MSKNEMYDPKGLDRYHYTEDRTFLQRMLWFCAGADQQILLKCPHSDRVKMEGIGGIVLATAVLAFFSGHEAALVIFNDLSDWILQPLALIVAVVWALIIFNLDRFIVSSTGHGDGKETISREELMGALPRIVLGIAIGLSLSAPLEIRIMKPEIEAELNVERQDQREKYKRVTEAEFGQDIAKATEERNVAREKLNGPQEAIKSYEQQIKDQRSALNYEVQGNVKSSGKPGYGPAAKQFQASIDENEKRMNQLEARFQGEKAQLEKDLLEKQNVLDEYTRKLNEKRAAAENLAMEYDGISTRIKIANKIAPGIHWALMFLLLAIEITPIFIKMMLITGPYDLLTENQKNIIYAKFAIEKEGSLPVDGDGAGEKIRQDVFHQADTIKEYEVGKLLAEASLAKTAQDIFLKDTEKDIKEHPDRYIKSDGKDATA